MKKLLGILGGLGPIASAEFLKTIYELNATDLEQELPACILYSDPNFPDRTNAIKGFQADTLVSHLVDVLESLCQLNVDKIVISCMTIHYFLPRVPARLREKVICLIDLIIQEVLRSEKRHLMLCTSGARDAKVFQQHNQWSLAEKYVVFPDSDDQNVIQSLIYQIKQNCSQDSIVASLKVLIQKYQVNSLILGCTELHLVTKHLTRFDYNGNCFSIVDPLLTFAKNIKMFTSS